MFAHPTYLHLLWFVPVVALILGRYLRWRSQALGQLGPKPERVISGFSSRRFWWKNGVILLALTLLAFSIATPRYGSRKVEQTQKAADVIIAFDISRSMLATDLRPSRLIRARLFAQELLREISGNRAGLIFFAGDAYLSMPLSSDYATIGNLLAEADPSEYSAQGTAISTVMALARKSFDPEPGAGRALVIITDGEDHEDNPVDAVEKAFDEDGVVTFIVGAGTTEGSQIPVPGGGVFKDTETNEPVLTQMDISLLEELADSGKGSGLFLVADNNNPARRLANAINELPKRNIAVRAFDERDSVFQWLLLPAILLLFAEGWMRWRRRENADKKP